jgi:hypothetical protein
MRGFRDCWERCWRMESGLRRRDKRLDRIEGRTSFLRFNKLLCFPSREPKLSAIWH